MPYLNEYTEPAPLELKQWHIHTPAEEVSVCSPSPKLRAPVLGIRTNPHPHPPPHSTTSTSSGPCLTASRRPVACSSSRSSYVIVPVHYAHWPQNRARLIPVSPQPIPLSRCCGPLPAVAARAPLPGGGGGGPEPPQVHRERAAARVTRGAVHDARARASRPGHGRVRRV